MTNFKPSFLSNIPPVVLNLMIINVLFWVASIIFPTFLGINLTEILGLHYWKSEKFNPIQFISYMFMHDTGSITHLFFNMFGIYMFGRALEQVWGGKKFLFFYFVAGIGAGIIQQLSWMFDFHSLSSAMDSAIAINSGEPLVQFSKYFTGNIADATAVDIIRLKTQFFNQFVTVGASGSLFGVLLAFGWLFPHVKMMLIFLPIPIPARIFVAIYAIVELFLGVTNFSIDNVAHFAHLGGMIFGGILLYIWHKQGKLYNNSNR